jgi:DNA-binding winged helix-turn-helix (wHTH) protein/tetratricopeptide (TPR) repeat protein
MMQYFFENYQFDSIQRILFKNGQIIALKRNETKLLNLFLSRPSDILSKNTILSEVWGSRVVSEQVVFQNISQLRTIFTDKAIKTFPKKGYQWQLDIKPEVLIESTELTELEEEPEEGSAGFIKKRAGLKSPSFVWVILASFMLLILLIFFLKGGTPEQVITTNVNKSNITVIPFENNNKSAASPLVNSFNQVINENEGNGQFKLNRSKKNISTRSFFNAPFLAWKNHQLVGHDLLLSGLLSSQSDGLLLRYRLQGVHRAWTGYLFSTSVDTLLQQLDSKLYRILASQYLTLEYDALVTSELTLIHNQHPDDHEVLLRLIERQIEQKNYDVAMAFTDKLITQSDPITHTAYLGEAFRLKGKVFHLRGSTDLAKSFYRQAHEVLATRNLLLLQSQVSKSEAWLGFLQEDYRQVNASLYQAATQAQLADEPLAEVEAYTLQSIFASKMGFDKEKYDYLYKAKSLLIDYQLDKANFAVIYYHFALFAENKEEAKSYFEKILALPYKKSAYWIKEDAQAHLAKYYMAQQAWQQALNLFPDRQSSAFSNNQRAQIYYAMDEKTKALDYVKQAFNQAIIQYKYAESLNAALLLYRMSIQSGDITGEIEYKSYIKKNTSKHWLDRHQDALKALGYFEEQNPP